MSPDYHKALLTMAKFAIRIENWQPKHVSACPVSSEEHKLSTGVDHWRRNPAWRVWEVAVGLEPANRMV